MYKTLFLDRDGVLNRRIVGDYVRRWSQFEWLPGVLEGLSLLRPHFDCMLVVTNQQGVGKGLMQQADLDAIHQNMKAEAIGIDAVYSCTELAHTQPLCRKPHIGMALQAQKEFPEIDFSQAWMLGDSLSDLQFAQNVGMRPVWIQSKEDLTVAERETMQALAQAAYPSLAAFAEAYLREV